ncbi:MAG TPA: hypothetical protein VFJ43_13715, partial [Bacteroidia bacterium]|nr:hypothetical protein [Bacteroidia bacterium]
MRGQPVLYHSDEADDMNLPGCSHFLFSLFLESNPGIIFFSGIFVKGSFSRKPDKFIKPGFAREWGVIVVVTG